MYNPKIEITNFLNWKYSTPSQQNIKHYAFIFEHTVGWRLPCGSDKNPKLYSINRFRIRKLLEAGFIPEEEYDFNTTNTWMSIPLLSGRNKVGAVLMALKRRKSPKTVIWSKYTPKDKLGSGEPLAAFSNIKKETPNGILVDSLSMFVKLNQWFANTPWYNYIVCYLTSPESLEVVQKNNLFFNKMYDLTHFNLKEKIKEMANRETSKLNVQELYTDDVNDMGGYECCGNPFMFQVIINHTMKHQKL